MMSATSAAGQGSLSPAPTQAEYGRLPVWQQGCAIAVERARIDELGKEAEEAEQEITAQLQEAPDSPEVALMRQRLACILADAAAVRQRIAEMRQQTPEKDRDALDSWISLSYRLRRYGPHGAYGEYAPLSQGWLPGWLECLLPSWVAQWGSPPSPEDAEVPAGAGVKLRGPGSATGGAVAGHPSNPHLHARHRHVEQQAAS